MTAVEHDRRSPGTEPGLGRRPNRDRRGAALVEFAIVTPVLVVHGTYDGVLPIEFGRATRTALEALPVELTYHEYPMAHEVSLESLRKAALKAQRTLSLLNTGQQLIIAAALVTMLWRATSGVVGLLQDRVLV